jgi:signal peptidase II
MRAVPLSRYLVFLLIVGGGVAADLATKHFMFDRLGMPGGRISWVWTTVFGFETSLNEGALFGVGQGMVSFFSVLSIAAALAIAYYLFVVGVARQWVLAFSLSAMTAGILGNLYDRMGLPGLKWHDVIGQHQPGDPVYAVRDWILIKFGTWTWPNFNIADSLLVCGALLLAWHAFFQKEAKSSEP